MYLPSNKRANISGFGFDPPVLVVNIPRAGGQRDVPQPETHPKTVASAPTSFPAAGRRAGSRRGGTRPAARHGARARRRGTPRAWRAGPQEERGGSKPTAAGCEEGRRQAEGRGSRPRGAGKAKREKPPTREELGDALDAYFLKDKKRAGGVLDAQMDAYTPRRKRRSPRPGGWRRGGRARPRHEGGRGRARRRARRRQRGAPPRSTSPSLPPHGRWRARRRAGPIRRVFAAPTAPQRASRARARAAPRATLPARRCKAIRNPHAERETRALNRQTVGIGPRSRAFSPGSNFCFLRCERHTRSTTRSRPASTAGPTDPRSAFFRAGPRGKLGLG